MHSTTWRCNRGAFRTTIIIASPRLCLARPHPTHDVIGHLRRGAVVAAPTTAVEVTIRARRRTGSAMCVFMHGTIVMRQQELIYHQQLELYKLHTLGIILRNWRREKLLLQDHWPLKVEKIFVFCGERRCKVVVCRIVSALWAKTTTTSTSTNNRTPMTRRRLQSTIPIGSTSTAIHSPSQSLPR